METTIFFLSILLCISLFLSLYKKGKWALRFKIVRIALVLISFGVFTIWFIKKSSYPYVKDSLTLQIINKLPMYADFHVIQVHQVEDNTNEYEILHTGKIRPEHYQVEYLKMEKSDEFWIVGYLGKDLVYFSQHAIQNKNSDSIVEVHSYINQSRKLSAFASGLIQEKKLENVGHSVWTTLCLVLLFLNILLLSKRK